MATFKDSNGRQWTIALDAPTIRTVRSECDGLDLADTEGKAFSRLVDDPCLLVDVLWILCRDEAQKNGLTDVQFGRALVGQAIEYATAAMLESIADFFPEKKRELIKAIAQKQTTLQTLGMQKALEKINDPALQEKALAALESRVEEDLRRALTQLSSATSGQARLESAPEA